MSEQGKPMPMMYGTDKQFQPGDFVVTVPSGARIYIKRTMDVREVIGHSLEFYNHAVHRMPPGRTVYWYELEVRDGDTGPGTEGTPGEPGRAN